MKTTTVQKLTTCWRFGKPAKIYRITDVKIYNNRNQNYTLRYWYGGKEYKIWGEFHIKNEYIYHTHVTSKGKEINLKVKLERIYWKD